MSHPLPANRFHEEPWMIRGNAVASDRRRAPVSSRRSSSARRSLTSMIERIEMEIVPRRDGGGEGHGSHDEYTS